MKKKYFILLITISFFFSSCGGEISRDEGGLPVLFHQRFSGTPLENLANAIYKESVWRVKLALNTIREEHIDINMREHYLGSSILDLAISCLYYGSMDGSIEILNLLLDSGLDINNMNVCDYSFDYYKKYIYTRAEPSLFLAVGGGTEKQIQILRLLVKRGLNVNMTCDGVSLLTRASRSTSLEVPKILIKAGADPHYKCIKDSTIYSPLNHAILYGSYDIALYYIKDLKVSIAKEDINHGGILRSLRFGVYEKNSKQYHNKMLLVKYLKEKKGLDYFKEPVPLGVQLNHSKNGTIDLSDY